MKKHNQIYIELLKLRNSFTESAVNINKCIRYNEDYQESKSYYEGQDEILKCIINDITHLIHNIESEELYENN